MQGRKSKTLLVIGCALTMLAAVAAFAPAFAGAQAAQDEYELGDLPSPDNDEASQTQSNEDEGAIAPTSSGSDSGTPTAPTGGETDPTGAVVDDGTANDNGKENRAGGGSGGQPTDENVLSTPASGESLDAVPAVDAEPSDGGGAPVLLILLAIVAALCTGVAIWRLRRSTDESGTESGKGVGPSGKTAETQSL